MPSCEPHDLTLFQQNLLYELAANGPIYGLGLKRQLEDLYGEEVNHGRLYPNLDDLVERGLVGKSALDRRTNEYCLTDAGARLLHRDVQRRGTVVENLADQGCPAVTDGGQVQADAADRAREDAADLTISAVRRECLRVVVDEGPTNGARVCEVTGRTDGQVSRQLRKLAATDLAYVVNDVGNETIYDATARGRAAMATFDSWQPDGGDDR